MAVLGGLLDEMERVMLLGYLLGKRQSGSDASHAQLVDALLSGNGERAAEIMVQQLHRNRAFVLDALLLLSSLQDVNLAAGSAALGRTAR